MKNYKYTYVASLFKNVSDTKGKYPLRGNFQIDPEYISKKKRTEILKAIEAGEKLYCSVVTTITKSGKQIFKLSLGDVLEEDE